MDHLPKSNQKHHRKPIRWSCWWIQPKFPSSYPLDASLPQCVADGGSCTPSSAPLLALLTCRLKTKNPKCSYIHFIFSNTVMACAFKLTKLNSESPGFPQLDSPRPGVLLTFSMRRSHDSTIPSKPIIFHSLSHQETGINPVSHQGGNNRNPIIPLL